jgi:hypothetical protein
MLETVKNGVSKLRHSVNKFLIVLMYEYSVRKQPLSAERKETLLILINDERQGIVFDPIGECPLLILLQLQKNLSLQPANSLNY